MCGTRRRRRIGLGGSRGRGGGGGRRAWWIVKKETERTVPEFDGGGRKGGVLGWLETAAMLKWEEDEVGRRLDLAL